MDVCKSYVTAGTLLVAYAFLLILSISAVVNVFGALPNPHSVIPLRFLNLDEGHYLCR